MKCPFHRLFSTLLLSLTSLSASAEIVGLPTVYITRINAYDDVPNAAAYVYFTGSLPECPNGAYVNPSAPHFKSLYTSLLMAFAMGKKVTVQLYTDRIMAQRCEMDGLQIFAE